MSETKPRRSYGTGSLYTRCDSGGRETWYGKWRTNGRQIKRKIGPVRTEGQKDGLTKRQAEAELRQLMAATPASAAVAERLTVEALGARYVRHLQHVGRKRSTIAAVDGHIRHWLAPFFGGRGIDSIRSEDVDDLIALMLAGQRPSGITRTKPLSAKTIVNAIGTLNAMFGYAQRKRWTSTNPVREVDLPGVEGTEEIRFLDPAEVDAVADAALPGPYQAIDRAFYITAAMTGLREGELIALRWRDVDWTAGRVRVRQNHVLGEFDTPKSKRSTRSVPMVDRVGAELDRLYRQSDAQREDDLVFPDPETAGPLSKPALLRRFRKALAAAHLDQTHRVHDLRHTFGTRCAAAGVPMRTLQEWMGHRDIATTQRYADYAPSAHEAAMVERAFAAATASLDQTTTTRQAA